MPKHKEPAPYRLLAEFYDEVFTPTRTPLKKARNELLKEVLPEVKSVCDLACGTGETALEFARRGIETFAVDLSPTMCRLACEKAARQELPVQVIAGDMRNFRLPQQVDLVTCESDALNHIARRSELRRVAAAVARALRPGGCFLFDVNNARGFRRYWTGNVWLEKPGVLVVMRNGHSKDALHAWSDLEWFVREGPGWSRHRERVEEVCWTRSEVVDALHDAGFVSIQARDAAPYFRCAMVTRGCHTFYLARRAGTR
jgi:SAM-dependent methyltransferase